MGAGMGVVCVLRYMMCMVCGRHGPHRRGAQSKHRLQSAMSQSSCCRSNHNHQFKPHLSGILRAPSLMKRCALSVSLVPCAAGPQR